jgi:hypothetical protein
MEAAHVVCIQRNAAGMLQLSCVATFQHERHTRSACARVGWACAATGCHLRAVTFPQAALSAKYNCQGPEILTLKDMAFADGLPAGLQVRTGRALAYGCEVGLNCIGWAKCWVCGWAGLHRVRAG